MQWAQQPAGSWRDALRTGALARAHVDAAVFRLGRSGRVAASASESAAAVPLASAVLTAVDAAGDAGLDEATLATMVRYCGWRRRARTTPLTTG